MKRRPILLTVSVGARRGGAAPRGMILIVVLFMIVLLALLAASYSYMVQANMRAAMAGHYQFQAKMAAESGFQRTVAILREARNDPSVWFNNPQAFRAVLVEGTEKAVTSAEDTIIRRSETGWYDPNAEPAWRFNVVARNYEDPTTVRYGVTDECSKLDLNSATQEQLWRLFERVIPQDTTNPVDVGVLVDSLLDWREPGNSPRANGAKNEFYQSLEPPYACKGAPFSTIEELLLVRGFSAWVLFGEDYNRNGLLDPNEDDGDASFPPDNADGVLYAGIAPFLTVWSREANVSADQRPRINLNMRDTQKLQELMSEEFSAEIVSYVMQVRSGGMAFNSVMNLLPAPPPPEAEDAPQDPQLPDDPLNPIEDPAASQPTTDEAAGIDAGSQPATTDLDQSGAASEKSPDAKPPLFKDLTEVPPPGTYEDLHLILDRLTTDPVPGYSGRINVNTAPREVLATIEQLTDEEVEAILVARGDLAPEERRTPAWVLTRGALDETKFRWILPRLATKSSVFQAECVGYADHVGVMDRFNVVFELRGPIAQVIYTRSLNELGTAYTPHTDELRTATQGGSTRTKR